MNEREQAVFGELMGHAQRTRMIDTLAEVAAPRIAALEAENERLRGALRAVNGLSMLAQCPVCLAERTNGERHDDDCPLVLEGRV